MIDHDKDAIDKKYESQFGYIAGYLPRDRDALDEWHRNLTSEVKESKAKGGRKKRSKAVDELAQLIELDGVIRMYVEQMIKHQPPQHKTVTDVADLLDKLNHIVTTAPLYNADPAKRNAFPMSSLFTYMMMTRAGEAVFRSREFNAAIRNILQEWCTFLDSAKSLYVLNEGAEGWLSKSAYALNKLYEFVIPKKSAPHWGWKSFNDYFHRQIKLEEFRPIDDPDNPKVIVSANDGKVYKIAENVQRTDKFWLKGQPYSLVNVLNNEYVDRFVGGSVFQSFLSGADYHRWRSPIDGVVKLTQIVDGLMFSDVESAGVDPTAATYSQGYEASVNTRGLVFIESDDPIIGMVCVIPIGITEISSVTINVKDGDTVKKGDELGWFSYGGSTMCLVFQPGAIKKFTVPNRPSSTNPDDGHPIKVNAQIALAR
jgi:phosphatidylserine decarboxylase